MHDRKHLRSGKDDAINQLSVIDQERHVDQHVRMDDGQAAVTSPAIEAVDNGDKVATAEPSAEVKNVFKIGEDGDFLSRLQKNSQANSSMGSSNGAIGPDAVPSFSNLNPIASSRTSSASPSPAPSSAMEGRVTRSQTASERGSERKRGLTGLYNLGNTCFMNSALQCMSNTKELKEYFVSGVYKSEVNSSNPLGMGGAMAKVFGELLSKLWSGGHSAWHPREFKTVLSRFSPQFIGYAQQDTQELLAFLLDGLHEDLNRIVKKPYIESPDWEGGGLKEMVAFAHKQWDIYKMRNDSVIVDLFQGQYRSTLVCPACAKVSIKFDPFMYLTLPIPNRKAFIRRVTFIAMDGTMTESEMRLTSETSFGVLKSMLAEWFNVADAKCLVACDIFSRSFYRIYTDFEAVNEIGAKDVTYIYQLPTPLAPIAPDMTKQLYTYRQNASTQEEKLEPPQKAEEYANLPLFSMSASKGGRFHSYSSRHSNTSFGQPLFLSISRESVNDVEAIQSAVLEAYARRASDPVALRTYLETLRNAPTEADEDGEDWEMLGASKILPTAQPENGEQESTVAEIHADGETVTYVADVARQEEDADKMEDLQSDHVATASKAPFSLHFLLHREDQAPTTLKPDSFDTYGEELRQRAKRLGFEKPDAKGKGQAHWPLVYSGGALVCVWSEEVRNKFFADNDDAWSTPIATFTDPALEAERTGETDKKKRTLTIDDCLNEFTKEEQLGESDPWYCPSCKEFKQATKKFDLWKVPDILVVHLKRFSSGRISRDKIDSVIDFPIDGLDLTDRVVGAQAIHQLQDEEGDGEDRLMESIGSLDANDDAVESDAPIYDLYAVDNHFGGLGGGHYTAYAKNPDDERWYYFDDSSVRPVRSLDEMKTSAAYLLFYRRRTTRPIGGKSREKVRERVRQSEECGEENNVNDSDDAAHRDGKDDGENAEEDANENTDVQGRGASEGQARLRWRGVETESMSWQNDTVLPAYSTVDDHDYDYQAQTRNDMWSGVYRATEQRKANVRSSSSKDGDTDDKTESLTARSSDDALAASHSSAGQLSSSDADMGFEQKDVSRGSSADVVVHLASGGLPTTTNIDEHRPAARAVGTTM